MPSDQSNPPSDMSRTSASSAYPYDSPRCNTAKMSGRLEAATRSFEGTRIPWLNCEDYTIHSIAMYDNRFSAQLSFPATSVPTTDFTAIVRWTHDGIIAEIPMIRPK